MLLPSVAQLLLLAGVHETIFHYAGARFQADLADPRFSGLFQSQDFAIDPTDPRFKQMGGGASAVATAVAKQRSRAIALDPTTADAAPSAPVPAGDWLRCNLSSHKAEAVPAAIGDCTTLVLYLHTVVAQARKRDCSSVQQ